MKKKTPQTSPRACSLLKEHFGNLPLHHLITASRHFPSTARVDLQVAIGDVFNGQQFKKFVGVHALYSHETLTVANLLVENDHAVLVGPLQYDEVEVGGKEPARCLKHGLWLCEDQGVLYGILLTPALKYGQSMGVHLEIAVPPGEAGLELTKVIFDKVEKRVAQAGSYRGKVLSLETMEHFSGKSSGILVHKLRPVLREEIILPEKTLKLLERNITQFVQQREKLRTLKMAVKKGLLFYGPPGTGKTHTIHYLASQMKDHTTLLITAEQVGLLREYMQLARFLQPTMVVIEDVDLIARARTSMRNPCEESLLNYLLNEMDGLREEAAILFILTTNQPEQLEAALASRPGRIDQAIEFPLPDEDGRRKLIRLYARDLVVPEKMVESIVRKTRKASAAFIKELMRRSAQFYLHEQKDGFMPEHVEAALDEMLFSGGTLNAKLLGAEGTPPKET